MKRPVLLNGCSVLGNDIEFEELYLDVSKIIFSYSRNKLSEFIYLVFQQNFQL